MTFDSTQKCRQLWTEQCDYWQVDCNVWHNRGPGGSVPNATAYPSSVPTSPDSTGHYDDQCSV